VKGTAGKQLKMFNAEKLPRSGFVRSQFIGNLLFLGKVQYLAFL